MKTIVITGASRGFGYHITRRALELGYTVIAVARSADFGASFAESNDSNLHTIEGSVSDALVA